MRWNVLIEPAIEQHVADGRAHGSQVEAEKWKVVKPRRWIIILVRPDKFSTTSRNNKMTKVTKKFKVTKLSFQISNIAKIVQLFLYIMYQHFLISASKKAIKDV